MHEYLTPDVQQQSINKLIRQLRSASSRLLLQFSFLELLMLISGVLKILQQHVLMSQQYFSNIAFYFTNNAGATLPADVPTLLKQHSVTNSQTNQRCAFERTVPDQNSRVARFELRCNF
jgi:hypothetical protein